MCPSARCIARSGNAVRRDPVTYSSIAAGDSAPSMSMEASLSCILRGQLRVRQALDPADRDLGQRPLSDGRSPPAAAPASADAAAPGSCSMRSVSVNASFAPLTVFSVSGGGRAALFPGFHLAAERLPAFRKQNHAEAVHAACSAACCGDSVLFDRRRTRPRPAAPVCTETSCARLVASSAPAGAAPARQCPCRTSARRETIPSAAARRNVTFRVSKSAAPSNCACNPPAPSTIAFHLVWNYCAAKRENTYYRQHLHIAA